MESTTHPFNDKYGISLITDSTTKLILGSFPPSQVINALKTRTDKSEGVRLLFYYGSRENKFWDLYYKAKGIDEDVDNLGIDDIIKTLQENKTGILDIIKKCDRIKPDSSSDSNLKDIVKEELVKILSKKQIDTIYSTSQFVTKLLKEQIQAECPNGIKSITKIKVGFFEYEQLILAKCVEAVNDTLKIKTLYSPSKNGLRGLKKGLNAKSSKITPQEYRLNQYKEFLNDN